VSEDVKAMLIEAIQHAREAEHAAREEQADAVVKHAERALKQIQKAQESYKNERLDQSAYALQDAIDHGKKGHAKDAADHLRHAMMRLSQAAGTQLPEGMQFARQDGATHVSEEARPMVLEAIQHAVQAANAGQQGHPEAIAKHARKAIGKVKQAQQAGHNERLNESVFALGDAIEHAEQGQTKDATEHASRAVATLSQAIGQEPGEGQQATTDAAGGRQAGMDPVQGEVVVKGEVLKIDQDGFYVIKDHAGQEVHLLVAEEMNRGFQIGDTISAQLKPDGTVSSIEKQDGSDQQSQLEGQDQAGRSGQSTGPSIGR
jgi:tetratricopeptide (TPR) repeat protein